MNVFQQYAKIGGPFGYIKVLLARELRIATLDAKHPLRPAIEAFQRKSTSKATRLLNSALMNSREEGPQSFQDLVKLVRLYLVRLPALAEILRKGDEIFPLLKNDAGLEDAVRLIEYQEDAKKHRASKEGAGKGGKNAAHSFQRLNPKQRYLISISTLPTQELASQYGVSDSYVRRLRRERNLGG